jgi:hypothetical protein
MWCEEMDIWVFKHSPCLEIYKACRNLPGNRSGKSMAQVFHSLEHW